MRNPKEQEKMSEAKKRKFLKIESQSRIRYSGAVSPMKGFQDL